MVEVVSPIRKMEKGLEVRMVEEGRTTTSTVLQVAWLTIVAVIQVSSPQQVAWYVEVPEMYAVYLYRQWLPGSTECH